MNFGDKLYTLRKSKGYSQDSLAEKLCISRQAVSKWELGEMLPDAENVIKLAKLFSVSTDYLLTDNTVDNLRRSKLIGLFTNKFDIVDFFAAGASLAASLSASLLYLYRLFWTYYTYDETITPKRDDYYIYWDRIWWDTIDEIIIIAFLFAVIIISAVIAIKIYRKYQQNRGKNEL